jgi:hypothetical protein
MIGAKCSETEHFEPAEGVAPAGSAFLKIVHGCTIEHLLSANDATHDSSKYNEKRVIPILVRPQQVRCNRPHVLP